MSTTLAASPDLDLWFRRYAGRLRGAARRIVGNDADAEDATQDAFLAAFRARDQYRSESDPYPWLHRIATRKALTIVASHRPVADIADVPAHTAVASAEETALANADARQVLSYIAADVPLALHLIDGLRFREVSAVLGIPPATAATKIRRGKHRLRRLLAATNLAPERSKAP